MTLKDQMESDLAVFFNTDEFAESIIYTPDGDFPRTITFIPMEGSEDNADRARDSVLDTLDIEVKVSDVVSPTYRDTFIYDEVTWYYKETLKQQPGGLTKELRLTRNERPTFRR